jgi:hypothetical protein
MRGSCLALRIAFFFLAGGSFFCGFYGSFARGAIKEIQISL